MTAVAPLALIIDHDFGFLGAARTSLLCAGWQVHARLSPQALGEFLCALRPEVILLGLPLWEEGWGTVLRSFSPDSIVFPIASATETPGVADLDRLPRLLRRAAPDGRQAEDAHAA